MIRRHLQHFHPARTWAQTSVLVAALSAHALFGYGGFAAAANGADTLNSPLAARDTLNHFKLAPGFRIELVACEPQVVDPVAMRFDEDGRLWVAEMRDYPIPPDKGQTPRSRIVVLEDRDGDGFYETSRIFADRLLLVNGLQPWRGGVIVTDSGKIQYLKDTNGDGRADRRETWFSGFAEKNPQLRVSHPRFALDRHVYAVNGLRGGEIVDHRRRGAAAFSIRGMDLRFDPLGTSSEPVSGMGQFGLTFDDFGNRFVCTNRNPLIHIVLENRYLRRNPHLAVPAVVHDVAAAGEKSRVFPISRAWTTSTLHAGQFTAACGVCLYRGGALGPGLSGNALTCEPTGNLVHREVVSAEGATFTARPARPGVEFLATADTWFRPVFLETGPDGGLYVVDMYRAVIEHPQFMPEELRHRRDLRDGDDRGRIYRIVARSAEQKRETPRLSEQRTADLVRWLEHRNAWWRTTAARLLYERQDRSVRAALEKMAEHGKTAAARVEALWSLKGLGCLSDEVLLEALARSDQPRVCEQALRLAEPRLATVPRLSHAVLALSRHDDARLRFQVALSLGELTVARTEVSGRREEVLDALASIALRDAADPWTRRAVASSVPGVADRLLLRLLESPEILPFTGGKPRLIEELAALVGARNDSTATGRVLRALLGTEPPSVLSLAARERGLVGLATGLGRSGASLMAAVDRSGDGAAALRGEIEKLFKAAAKSLLSRQDKPGSADTTVQTLRFLRFAPFETAGSALKQLAADDSVPQGVRLAAIDALSANRDPRATELLLADFSAATPSIRKSLIAALLRTPARSRALLDRIEAGEIAATEVGPLNAAALQRHRDAEIRRRAKQLLGTASADRQKVVAQYRPALELVANAKRGQEVFKKNCSTCHRVAGIGVDVAPDIADSRVKTPRQLLTDILIPNAAIDNNYLSYTIITADGRTLTGIIAAETPTSLTLKQPENKTVTLLRSQIDQMQSAGVSLMPEGLERNIDRQQMADLISFIKNWRYLDGNVPLPGFGRSAGSP